jgi:hypothetical protein
MLLTSVRFTPTYQNGLAILVGLIVLGVLAVVALWAFVAESHHELQEPRALAPHEHQNTNYEHGEANSRLCEVTIRLDTGGDIALAVWPNATAGVGKQRQDCPPNCNKRTNNSQDLDVVQGSSDGMAEGLDVALLIANAPLSTN